MKVIRPPTFREMLDLDPTWKSFILKTPRLPAGCRPAEPFRVWGIRVDDKWAGKSCSDYAAAFAVVKSMLRQPEKYRDVTLICRPVAFGPPAGMTMPMGMDWCGHCRRPSVFRRVHSHPAMKRWPVISDEDVKRCYYCAARGPEKVWHW